MGGMSVHTAGPWLRDGLTIYALMHAGWRKGVAQLKNRFHLHIYGDYECPAEEVEANARLIAAAPELLEALRNLSGIVDAAILAGDWKVDGACDPDLDIKRARTAIAKARGNSSDLESTHADTLNAIPRPMAPEDMP